MVFGGCTFPIKKLRQEQIPLSSFSKILLYVCPEEKNKWSVVWKNTPVRPHFSTTTFFLSLPLRTQAGHFGRRRTEQCAKRTMAMTRGKGTVCKFAMAIMMIMGQAGRATGCQPRYHRPPVAGLIPLPDSGTPCGVPV